MENTLKCFILLDFPPFPPFFFVGEGGGGGKGGGGHTPGEVF